MYYLNDLGKKAKKPRRCPAGAHWGKRQNACVDRKGQPVSAFPMVPSPMRNTQPLPFQPEIMDEFSGEDQGDFYPTDFSQGTNAGAGVAPWQAGGGFQNEDAANAGGFYAEAQGYEGEAGGMEGLSEAATPDPTAQKIVQYRDIALETFLKTQQALRPTKEQQKQQQDDRIRTSTDPWGNALLVGGGLILAYALYKSLNKKG